MLDDPELYNNFELYVEFVAYNPLDTAAENFGLAEKVFERVSAQKLVVFPDCEIVNQTDFMLHCGLSKKEHHVKNSVVRPFGRTLYETSLNSKIAIKTPGYHWSSRFSVTTLGLTGALTLKKKPEKARKKEKETQHIDYIKSIYKTLDLGIKLSSGTAPFSRTKVVTIVPRYVIANNLKFDLVYRQTGSTYHQEFVPAESHEPIYLPLEMDEDEIQLRAAVPDEAEEHCDEALLEREMVWSSGFSISDI